MADPLSRFRPTSDTLARSLFDRLLDANPDLATDPLRTIGEQTRDLREGLRRDLETLLNTRCCPKTPDSDPGGELADSLLTYGVEDFFTTSLVTDGQRAAFARALQKRIAACEPRLESIRVEALPPRQQGERTLRLRIEARYRLQPGLPAISFETSIDPTTQRLAIETGHG